MKKGVKFVHKGNYLNCTSIQELHAAYTILMRKRWFDSFQISSYCFYRIFTDPAILLLFEFTSDGKAVATVQATLIQSYPEFSVYVSNLIIDKDSRCPDDHWEIILQLKEIVAAEDDENDVKSLWKGHFPENLIYEE